MLPCMSIIHVIFHFNQFTSKKFFFTNNQAKTHRKIQVKWNTDIYIKTHFVMSQLCAPIHFFAFDMPFKCIQMHTVTLYAKKTHRIGRLS